MNTLDAVIENDFRVFLEHELNSRSSTNPNYSLRAFARDLTVDSSFLSKLLNGKRAITIRTILTLAPRLALSEDQVQDFVQGAKGRRRRSPIQSYEIEKLIEIENEITGQTLDWCHIAILALFDLKSFQADTVWIAKRLNLSPEQSQQALDDLFKMQFLSKDADGTLKRNKSYNTVSTQKYPRVDFLKKNILQQASMMAPQGMGDHSAMTIAVSESRMAEATERIRKFRRELAYFLNEPSEKDSVYHLAISLFPAISK